MTATQAMCEHTCLIGAEPKQAATEAAAAELSEARQQLQRERADATERVAALADASLRMQARPHCDHQCDRVWTCHQSTSCRCRPALRISTGCMHCACCTYTFFIVRPSSPFATKATGWCSFICKKA